jgi:hypothetical protein
MAWILGFILSIFYGCTVNEPNLSTLRLDRFEEEFFVTELFETEKGEIYCVGRTYSNQDVIIKQFDSKLNPLGEVNINEKLGLNGDVRVSRLSNGHWRIFHFVESARDILNIYETDSDFNILIEKKLSERNDPQSIEYDLIEMKEMQDGGCLLVLDSHYFPTSTSYGYGNRIVRLNKNLETQWFFAGKKEIFNSVWVTSNAKVVELDDGSVFYACSVSEGVFRVTRRHILYGLIDKNGKLVYQKITDQLFDNNPILSISKMGNSVVLNFAVNSNDIHYYFQIDPVNGEILEERNLDQNINQPSPYWQYIYGHSKLPNDLLVDNGYFLLDKTRQVVSFITVGTDMQVDAQFELGLHPFDNIQSIRHLKTKEGNIVVAVSSDYRDQRYLEVQKIDLSGRPVIE